MTQNQQTCALAVPMYSFGHSLRDSVCTLYIIFSYPFWAGCKKSVEHKKATENRIKKAVSAEKEVFHRAVEKSPFVDFSLF